MTANVAYSASSNGNIAAGGASPQLSYTFPLPDGSAGVGSLQITVTCNANGALYEYNSSGTATSNDTIDYHGEPQHWRITPTRRSRISPSQSCRASPQSGNRGALASSWSDYNIGDGPVNAAFSDYVLVQRQISSNNYTTIASGNLSGNSTLAAGASSPQTFTFSLPNGAAGAGTIVVTVTTDSGQTIKEYDSNGNAAYGNNTNTASFTATIAAYPDLQVQNLALDPASVPQSGGTVVLDWNDANTGNGPAVPSWYDSVQVINTTTGQTLASADVFNNTAASGPLTPGNATPHSFNFQLPAGTPGVGNLAVTVTTNASPSEFL